MAENAVITADVSTNEDGKNVDIIHPPRKLYQLIGALACASIHLGIGVLFGITATTLPEMMDATDDDPLSLTETEATYVVSAISIGALIGSFLSSPLLFHFGQRKLILISLPLMMGFWVLLSQSYVVWLVLACRLAQGIVNGLVAGAASTYIVEVGHPSIRGRMLGSLDFSRQIGFLLVYSVGSTQLSWRNVALICGVLTQVVPFGIFVFMPDSPRWLATKHRNVEARHSLEFFRGNQYDVDSEFNEILSQFSDQKKQPKIIHQLKMLKNRHLAVLFTVMIITNFLLHFTGSMAISAYAVVIFQAATKDVNAYLSTMFAGCARVIGSASYLLIADRFGRRNLFLVPHAISLIFISLLGLYFKLKTMGIDLPALRWMPVVCAILYSICFSMSNPPILAMRNELLPTSFRSFGVGMIYTAFFGGAFTVSMTFFPMVNNIGLAWTFWIFAICGIVNFVLVLLFIPESSGKSLESIDVMKNKPKFDNITSDNNTSNHKEISSLPVKNNDHFLSNIQIKSSHKYILDHDMSNGSLTGSIRPVILLNVNSKNEEKQVT